jgi:UDP-N-acetylmuramoyl-tripeptide--D-alanyl-D-alanine ligase
MLIDQLHALFLRHPEVTTDSRNCPKGALFFALTGDNFDGNRYAQKALEAGCAYAIIDNPDYIQGEKTMLVNNVLATLQALAQFHRSTFTIPIIGITGTNGKTTTKELLATVLSTELNVLYTEGNLNNHIGVPLTLLRLKPQHQVAIIEMGASKPGDIAELAAIAQPTFGLITNIGKAHLEGFGSFEGVISTKGELFEYLRQVNGIAFVRQENSILQQIAQGMQQINYGTTASATIRGNIIDEQSSLLSFRWYDSNNTPYQVTTHLIGGYNLENALAAVAIGCHFDITPKHINQALSDYTPKNNRSQLTITPKNTLIVDAYNANPSSMKVALDNFASLKALPKAVILGDMRELGEASESEHRSIVELVKTGNYDLVLFCGKQLTQTPSCYSSFETVEDLIQFLSQTPLQGYHILIKGSRGIQLEKVLPLL